jgi:transglutaminase-like putative cysteine protease
MFLRVTHHTRYDYSQPVTFAPHAIYLRPRETPRQRLHNFALSVSPTARRVPTGDAEDNALEWAYFDAATFSSTLEVHSEFLVETHDVNPFDFFLLPNALNFPFAYDDTDRHALAPCLILPRGSDEAQLRAWLAQHVSSPPPDTIGYLSALNSAVRSALAYRRRDEPGIQTPAETLALGGGSCRDYAVFLAALCRFLGLAARFVSGYLHEPPAADIPDPLPPAMHAWTEVYLPGAGWRALDSTRGIWCDDSFIPVAHAALAESVNPVQGGFYGQAPSLLTSHLTLEKL